MSETKIVKDDHNIGDLPLKAIVPDPDQPRRDFDEEKIKELAKSIKEHGLLQPILVIPIKDGKFQIVHGERRYRACKLLGLETIMADIRELPGKQVPQIQLVENVQREDLNPIEEAEAFRMLIDTIGFTHEELAERIGKSREYVTNKLRLLNLPKDLQRGVATSNLSEGHARLLLSLGNPSIQRKVCEKISEEKLSVRETEHFVHSLKETTVSRETFDNQTSKNGMLRRIKPRDLEVWKIICPEKSEIRKWLPVDELIPAYIKDLKKLRGVA